MFNIHQLRIWLVLAVLWSIVQGPSLLAALTDYQDVKSASAATPRKRSGAGVLERSLAVMLVEPARALLKREVQIYITGFFGVGIASIGLAAAFPSSMLRRRRLEDEASDDVGTIFEERLEPTFGVRKEAPTDDRKNPFI